NLEDYNEKKIIEVQKFKASEALKEKVNQMIADKEKLERLEEKFRELEKKQGILEKEGWQLEVDLKKYNLYQTELKNLRERFTDIETRDKEIDTLRKKWSELNDKCLESEEKYKSLLTRQKAAIAESLRADLVEGQPCPVCGGTHHPKISIENSDGVPEAELERAEKEMRSDQEKKNNLQTTGKNKREERNKRQEECIKACENIREVNDEITDIQNVQNVCDLLDQIEIKQKNKKEEHDKNSKQIKECKVEKNKIEIEKDGLKKGIIAAKTAEDQLKNIQTEYDEFKGQMIQARSAIEKTLLTMDEKLDFKNEAINITPLKDKINKDIVLVEQKIGYKKTIELQFREVEDQQVIGETDLKNAKTRMVGDIEDAKKRKEEFEVALNEKNLDFETYSAHQNISNQALEVLEEGIKKYESECQVTEAKLKELAQVLSKQEKVDLDELNNQLKELSKSIETCRKEVLMVDQRARINRQQIQKISEKAIDLERIEKKEGLYEKLDKTIKGTLSGRPKISFERYILSAYLQDILESANLFLEQMSGNRYRLEVMEELKKGNGRGLEIEVVDAYTGLRRSANTLSGGETFMAALSMALGLSDIVQSYAGGIVLDTIFIDEGFATLDPEALDNAINCLLSIKNDGRTVGIISHVEELKERIDTKISVEKTETGSHICMNNERNRT
ncbi:MAG: SbcC/MukB-like Walker B domain-containing protein, partial [Eubacterium sp.]